MRKCLAAVSLLVVSWMTPLPARACSCLEQPFEMAHAGAAAIFEGRVASVTTQEDGRLLVAFDVVQTWREAGHEHVEVVTASNEVACGYPFEIGTSYLVYAGQTEGERYVVSLCSRTRRMADADDDRALLGSGVVPVDIVDDPESDEPTPRTPPTHAGCASCSVARTGGEGHAALGLAMLAIAYLTRRFRS
jgi:MYXO-CTERM domain-containing protein